MCSPIDSENRLVTAARDIEMCPTIVQKTEKLSCLQAPINDHGRRHHGSNRQHTDTSNQQREPGGNALSATQIQNIVKFDVERSNNFRPAQLQLATAGN